MTTSQATEVTLHADREHAGLRSAVLIIVLGGFLIGSRIINSMLARGEGFVATYSVALSCVLGLVAALAIAGVAEALMKRYWPSGRRLEIDSQQLRAWLPEGESVSLDWSGRVWAIKWTFSLEGYPRGGRERRLTKKHHCLACQLQQDESRVIVYSYLPRAKAKSFLDGADFHPIRPADHYEKGPLRRLRGAERPQIPTKVLTGKDGPYWLAEQRRWATGIELTAGDFVTFWQAVKDRLEE